MLPRERQLAAIRHEPPDRIPTDCICVENVAEIAGHLQITPETVLDRLGIDGRLVAAAWIDPLDEGISEWGTVNSGDYGTARPAPLAHAERLAEIEQYAWPDAAGYDYAGVAVQAREFSRRYAVRGPYWKPLFCQVCDLFGMEEAMARLLLEEAQFEAALEHVFQITLDYCARLLDACGDALDIFCLGDDFATQRGLMIDPVRWRRLLKPRYAALFALGKTRGKPVWFHSCGDITAVLPDLIDIGLDVWETVQLHALPMSPAALKREFGAAITFFGGVSTQRLPFATPGEVADEARACIAALGQGGGYICGPDHHIKPDVPPANAVALFDAATGFRGVGYTG